MADNFISGNTSYVTLGALAYSFGGWRLNVDGGTKKFFALGSNFQRTTAGGIAGTPVLDGPYNAGNMPLVIGTLYELHLGFAPGIELVLTARFSVVDYSTKVEAGGDPAQCSASFDSDGSFGISFN